MATDQTDHKMELLAPAGSWEAFKAAVENGADAVYLGGKSFNARAGAANFDLEQLRQVVRYAHERQVKVYVTVNILIADSEFPELVDYLFDLYEIGMDAVILQDLGVAALLQRVLPEIERHASTQMTINNSWGVKYLEQMGFRRVVLARETSARAMREIAAGTPVEIEVFGHGALCICYSGQCLMSSFIGGRSGNRGTCAQPCRMTYQLMDKRKQDLLAEANYGEHLLSPRDLNLVDHLAELQANGVVSLKVEGRMKRPEYVATVIRIYRQALDRLYGRNGPVADRSWLISPEERQELTQIFNRDFTEGYLYSHPGAGLMSFGRPNNRGTRLGRIVKTERGRFQLKLEACLNLEDGIEVWTGRGREGLTVERLWDFQGKPVAGGRPGDTVQVEFSGAVKAGDRVFKTHDAALMEKARQSFQEGREQRKRPLAMVLSGRTGEKLRLAVQDGERRITVDSLNDAQPAQTRPLTAEFVTRQLSRLGTTPFWLERLELNLEGEIMVPVSDLNDMRRRAVEELLTEVERPRLERATFIKRVQVWREELVQLRHALRSNYGQSPRLTVAISDPAAVRPAIERGAERLLIGGEHWRSRSAFSLADIRLAMEQCREKRLECVWRLPRVFNQAQGTALHKELAYALSWPDRPTVMIGNLGALEILRLLDPAWPFEVDYSLNVFNESSLAHLLAQGAHTVTLSPELKEEQIRVLARWPGVEMMVFGDLEMMVSEYCPVGATMGDKKGDHCQHPCLKDKYYLRDRMNFDFPIETDQECRMHLFNVKRLNLLNELDQITAMGINSVRLQLIRETPLEVGQIVGVFAEAWKQVCGQARPHKAGREQGRTPGEDGRQILTGLFGDGFTKGHFFRGIVG